MGFVWGWVLEAAFWGVRGGGVFWKGFCRFLLFLLFLVFFEAVFFGGGYTLGGLVLEGFLF